jgi:hypothetical protein
MWKVVKGRDVGLQQTFKFEAKYLKRMIIYMFIYIVILKNLNIHIFVCKLIDIYMFMWRVGKSRDVGLQQTFKFEAKLSQENDYLYNLRI